MLALLTQAADDDGATLAHREFVINNATANAEKKFCGNNISTTKYTMYSFLPKGLYEQFRRVANVYFLLIAAMSATPISPVSPVTNIFPLVCVLSVSLLKEAFEDYKRYVKDREINQDYTEVRAIEDARHLDDQVHALACARGRAGEFIPAPCPPPPPLHCARARLVWRADTLSSQPPTPPPTSHHAPRTRLCAYWRFIVLRSSAVGTSVWSNGARFRWAILCACVTRRTSPWT